MEGDTLKSKVSEIRLENEMKAVIRHTNVSHEAIEILDDISI